MKPGAGSAGAGNAPAMGASQWDGLEECIQKLKDTGKSKAHVFGPSKETKAVVCEKTQYGEILHAAKFTAVFYMTVQGGHDFELPEYRKIQKIDLKN